MIHAIYIYFIVSFFIFGYQIGDSFSDYSPMGSFFISLFWLPLLIWEGVIKAFLFIKNKSCDKWVSASKMFLYIDYVLLHKFNPVNQNAWEMYKENNQVKKMGINHWINKKIAKLNNLT